MAKHSDAHVLVLTGGLLDANETSFFQALKKISLQTRASQSAWLEHRIKLVGAEPIVSGQIEALMSALFRKEQWAVARKYLKPGAKSLPPELTEVVLATALEKERIPFTCASYSELLADPTNAENILRNVSCVFASSTFLRDLSELEPLIKLIKRPHLRIVVGGALAGLLKHHWDGVPEVDLLAVGYGETLVPILAQWIRSGFAKIDPPPGATVEDRVHTRILIAPHPAGNDLDSLPRPDWSLPQNYRGKKFDFIHYESVRGCPYRCAFCNYPYLFNDKRFRYKSAQKIADDWTWYSQHLGIHKIQCLDSLFTMPKKRLIELCEELIKRNLPIKWICYARADDLCDEATVQLMKKAGAYQVQIGLESGDSGQLSRMSKSTTVEQNLLAIQNCRKFGITSIVSLIVGFPGETVESLERTYQFMETAKPDFHFLATFSVRVPGVPVLSQESRKRFDLWTMENPRTVSPYWDHSTMSCSEVSGRVRELNRKLQSNKISLDASVFYHGLLDYDPSEREALLDFQARAISKHPVITKIFSAADYWIAKRLRDDLKRHLSSRVEQVNSQGGDFVQA